MTVNFINTDCWQALYIDGDLKLMSNSVLDPVDVMRALGIDFILTLVDENEWLVDGYPPKKLNPLMTVSFKGVLDEKPDR